MDIAAYLEEKRQGVDQFLGSLFQGNQKSSSKLLESMRYSLLAGGKRIRPVLTLAAFDVCSLGKEKNDTAVLKIASAIEMIHTYSLIHDDLPAMDNDDLRRGRPTNHKAYGEAIAILAGDSLLTEAFGIIAKSGVDSKLLLEIVADIAEASGSLGMAGGQAIDLESEGQKITPKELETLHRLKTGCLIKVSVMAGAKMAGAQGQALKAMEVYGDRIGVAFQIADDILDVEGGSKEMGKATGGDAAKNKATYPSIIGMEASKKMASTLCQEAIDALKIFETHAEPLREIASYIVGRRK